MGKIKERLRELFNQCADVNGWDIQKLSINKDHVHMLIQLKPKVSISKAVQFIKDGSSKIIKEEFPELEEFLWADGFFAETVGKCNEEIIRQYIENQ